jgi:hypothetical protein
MATKSTTPKAPVSKNAFSFPQEAAEAIRSADQSFVGLPFDTYVWFVKNGRPAAKASGGVAFTGGFASSSFPEAGYQVTDVRGAVWDLSKDLEPLTTENLNTQGQSYSTVDLQTLVITPIAHRKRWHEGRSHAQILCLQSLPSPDKAGNNIVVYALLSARGFQSSILLDEIGRVASNTNNERRELGNPPASFFWHRVGMPSTPDFRPVGKGATSIITPVKAALLEGKITDSYIGDEMAKLIAETVQMDEVIKWRDAWKDERATASAQSQSEDEPMTPNGYQVPF